jgi:hypothetical protein
MALHEEAYKDRMAQIKSITLNKRYLYSQKVAANGKTTVVRRSNQAFSPAAYHSLQPDVKDYLDPVTSRISLESSRRI